MSIETAKKDLIEVLESIDKNKLSLPDLQMYAFTLKTASEIEARSSSDIFAETMAKIGNGFGPKTPTVSDLK